MPDFNQISNEIKEAGTAHDVIRRKYLSDLNEITERNVIVYYSGWLQNPLAPGIGLNDNDKIGFMSAIHGLDRTKGLDLVLHTPGGEIAATESIVNYLRVMFDNDVRAIIPQLALSGGTMIACSCKKIIMGKQSSLGPIDPQFGPLPAHGVIEEIQTAHREIKADPSRAAIWQPIIAKYNPTLIGECHKAIDWANEMVKEWLVTGMLINNPRKETIASNIVTELGNHALTKSHNRHIPPSKCMEMGLEIEMMEDVQKLQDAILSIHHACIQTLSSTTTTKIIENHMGETFLQTLP